MKGPPSIRNTTIGYFVGGSISEIRFVKQIFDADFQRGVGAPKITAVYIHDAKPIEFVKAVRV